MTLQESQNIELFKELLKEVFTAFPYLKSLEITSVGKELVEDRKASCPEYDMMYVSSINLETKNKSFDELSAIDQKKLKSHMMESYIFKRREEEGLNSTKDYQEKYEEMIKQDLSYVSLNKLVVIAALDANIIKTEFLNTATKDYSASHQFVFTSEAIKEEILNKKFVTHIVKNEELGSDEFKTALLKKPKLF